MVSLRNCSGCEYLVVDEDGMRCAFVGLCVYKKEFGRPYGYRTPEDKMPKPERRDDAGGRG